MLFYCYFISEPPARVPYEKQSHRTVFLPSCAFASHKGFALWVVRQGRCPLTPRTFKKVRPKLQVILLQIFEDFKQLISKIIVR